MLSGLLALEAAPLQAQASPAAVASGAAGGSLSAVGDGPSDGPGSTQSVDPAPEDGATTAVPPVEPVPGVDGPSAEVTDLAPEPVEPSPEVEAPSVPVTPSAPGLDQAPGDVVRVDPRTGVLDPLAGVEISGRAGPVITQALTDVNMRSGLVQGPRFTLRFEGAAPPLKWEQRAPNTVVWEDAVGTVVTNEFGGITSTHLNLPDRRPPLAPFTIAEDGWSYRVNFNPGTSASTFDQWATLHVWDFSVTPPVGAVVTEGQRATFRSRDTWGNEAFEYTWQQRASSASPDWDTASGGYIGGSRHDTTYTTQVSTLSMHGSQYRVAYLFCVNHGSCGPNPLSLNTSAVTLKVLPAVPRIISQPGDGPSVNVGATAAFVVRPSTSVAPEATLQWSVSTDGGTEFDDIDAADGGTAERLNLPGVTLAMSGNKYKATYTNTNGGPNPEDTVTTESNVATLTVRVPLSIDEQPTVLPVTEGAPATLTSVVSGPDNHKVQWQQFDTATNQWVDVTTGTNRDKPVHTTAATTLGMHGARYRVVATIGRDKLESQEVALTVWPATPVITQPPLSKGVAEGADATFTVTRDTSVAPGATVQWWVQPTGGTWKIISGANAMSLNLGPATLAQNGNSYKAEFTNTNGSADQRGTVKVESSVAVLTVLPGTLTIVTDPRDTPVAEGADATFQASFGGTSGGVYSRWKSSGDGGQTWRDETADWSLVYEVGGISSFTVRGASYDDHHGRLYRAEFTVSPGVSGSELSTTAAKLTVTPTRPRIPTGPVDLDIDEGDSGTFTSTVDGAVNTQMSWDYQVDGTSDWVEVTGATASNLTLSEVTAAMDGRTYRLTVLNPLTQGTSVATARLTVQPRQPVVKTHPGSGGAFPGSGAVFSVELELGTPTATVQWYSLAPGGDPVDDWDEVDGATALTLVTGPVTVADHGTLYRAEIANGWVSPRIYTVTTTAGMLNVLTAPTVIESPLGKRVVEGTEYVFTAKHGDGTGSPVFVLWEMSTDGGTSWSGIGTTMQLASGTTTSSLTISAGEMTLDLNMNQYRARFSNMSLPGGVATDAAVLEVVHTPPSSTITLTPRAYQVEQFTTS